MLHPSVIVCCNMFATIAEAIKSLLDNNSSQQWETSQSRVIVLLNHLISNVNPTLLFQIRECEMYKDEYKDCTSFRARFQQYFVYGETLDCNQWKKDYDNCCKWESKRDMKAAVSTKTIKNLGEFLFKMGMIILILRCFVNVHG